MKPGMTEREVQLELEDFMVRNGAKRSGVLLHRRNGR